MPRLTIERVRQQRDTSFPTATAAVKAVEELGILALFQLKTGLVLPIPALCRFASSSPSPEGFPPHGQIGNTNKIAHPFSGTARAEGSLRANLFFLLEV